MIISSNNLNTRIYAKQLFDEIFAPTSLVLISALFAKAIFPSMTYPLLIMSGSFVCVRLAVKIETKYAISVLSSFERFFWKRQRDFPHLKLTALLSVIVAAKIFPLLAFLISGVLGAFGACSYRLNLLELSKKQEEERSQKNIRCVV